MKQIFFIFALLFGQKVLASSDPSTVSHVDLKRYQGIWYEVASIPQSFQKKCVKNTSAVYSLLPDGLVKVENSCETAKGDRKIAEGRARVEDSKTNSKLRVTFVKLGRWIFSFGGNYWILGLDENYSYAIIGDPTRKYAWILSRSPGLPMAVWREAEKTLRSKGYDTCQILTSVQDGGLQNREPLCQYVR